MKFNRYGCILELTSNTYRLLKHSQHSEEVTILLFSALMRLVLKYAGFSFEPTQCKRDEDRLERVKQRKGHQSGQGLEQTTFRREADIDGLVWLGEEKAQAWGVQISVFHGLEGVCREERDKFFSEVHSERSKGSNHKLHQGVARWAKGRNPSHEGGPALERAVHGGLERIFKN